MAAERLITITTSRVIITIISRWTSETCLFIQWPARVSMDFAHSCICIDNSQCAGASSPARCRRPSVRQASCLPVTWSACSPVRICKFAHWNLPHIVDNNKTKPGGRADNGTQAPARKHAGDNCASASLVAQQPPIIRAGPFTWPGLAWPGAGRST